MKYITPAWPVPTHIKAFTTTKAGWGKSLMEQEDRKNHSVKLEAENQSLINLLHLPSAPIWLTQTHSNEAIEATPANQKKSADASYTTENNRVCVVCTADCLPILVTNKSGSVVAAIHAGWRGLANDIIEVTLQKLHCPYEDLLVWLGPAIGPTRFEVGKEVFTSFTQERPQALAAFKPHTQGKWLANLYALASERLRTLGVQEIYGGEYCTYTQTDLFFSYRHDKGRTGRMASLIWMEEKS